MKKEIKRCLWPPCGKKMPNAHPNKKFCCSKHRYKFHNWTNPRGKFAHLHPNNRNYVDDLFDIENTMHPHDSYSLGQD